MLPLLLLSSLSARGPSAARLADKRLNVLMIAVDDLRPDLGCYGADYISSPNIDRLAASSLLLRQAHVQQAVCSPTRTSLLTSRRPDTTRVYDLKHHFRDMANNFTTLPEYFKRRGYASVGLGKIFHPVVCRLTGQIDDIPARGVDGSWTMAADKGGQPYYHGAFEKYWQNGGPSPNSTGGPCAKPRGCPSHLGVTAADEAARPLPDTQAAQRGAAALATLAQRNNPFFLAVGIHKPHLPFIVPEAFLSAYPNASVPLATTPSAPAGMPEVAWSPFGEMRGQYYDVHALNLSGAVNASRGVPDGLARALRRHYYAAVSYTDALVGSLLDALDATGAANHTVVALWGDHGWQLGEHGEWCKQTNFEIATHGVMMIKVPGFRGAETSSYTEFVDLYPTLADMAGCDVPVPCPDNATSVGVETCTEGVSMRPLFTDPTAPFKAAAFSQYPRPNMNDIQSMGYSMVTKVGGHQLRYTEWVPVTLLDKEAQLFKPDWSTSLGLELYNHSASGFSFDEMENVNIAAVAGAGTLVALSKQLRAHFQRRQPPV